MTPHRSPLRALAVDDPTILPGLIARDLKLVRDVVNGLYRDLRSGPAVAAKIGIAHRTLKRWLLRFEEAGIAIPATSKGSIEIRDRRKKQLEKAAARG